jgi:drug/metabolite transporter superfamily protein YnfA
MSRESTTGNTRALGREGLGAGRVYFAYGSIHVFAARLGQWPMTNRIPLNGPIDGLIFLSVAMLVSEPVVSGAERPETTGIPS